MRIALMSFWCIMRESHPTSQSIHLPQICIPLGSLHAESQYKVIFPNISVRLMTINHGKGLAGVYDGACYFIRHDPTHREFIFFGDVEADSICAEPRNIAVWRAAAPKIPHDISTIFIECSYQIGRPVEQLWGHLSPEYLVQELIALATEVVYARQGRGSRSRKGQQLPPEALCGALRGVKVYITHCKEHFTTQRPINHVIGDECRGLLAPHRLGVELLTADQGMKIGGSNRPIGFGGYTDRLL